jgi:hypothetical protein
MYDCLSSVGKHVRIVAHANMPATSTADAILALSSFTVYCTIYERLSTHTLNQYYERHSSVHLIHQVGGAGGALYSREQVLRLDSANSRRAALSCHEVFP